jgi:Mg2+ and Co2+ transporter CorA
MSSYMTNDDISSLVNSINIMEEQIKNLHKNIEAIKKIIISKLFPIFVIWKEIINY